jgi:hypothetical protein
VQWVNLGSDKNTWIPRDQLIDMGFEKMVVEVDAKEAAQVRLLLLLLLPLLICLLRCHPCLLSLSYANISIQQDVGFVRHHQPCCQLTVAAAAVCC